MNAEEADQPADDGAARNAQDARDAAARLCSSAARVMITKLGPGAMTTADHNTRMERRADAVLVMPRV